MREALNGRPAAERTRRTTSGWPTRIARSITWRRRPARPMPAWSRSPRSGKPRWAARSCPARRTCCAAITRIPVPAQGISRQQVPFRGAVHHRADLPPGPDDDAAARTTFEEFLRRYPHHSLVVQAKQALAELDQPKQPARRRPRKQPADEAHIQPPPPPTPTSHRAAHSRRAESPARRCRWSPASATGPRLTTPAWPLMWMRR